MDKIYPRMSYHKSWPNVMGIVIYDEAQDAKLEDGWDDTYGVRSAKEVKTQESGNLEPQLPLFEAKRKPGRPKKVTDVNS